MSQEQRCSHVGPTWVCGKIRSRLPAVVPRVGALLGICKGFAGPSPSKSGLISRRDGSCVNEVDL